MALMRHDACAIAFYSVAKALSAFTPSEMLACAFCLLRHLAMPRSQPVKTIQPDT
jgi:hypothetical protein